MTLASLLSLPTVWLLGVVISRPLGLDFSLTRKLLAGLLAFTMTTSVIRAITPASVVAEGSNFPAFWYLLLGSLISVVVAMVLLVLVEALVPSGALPGPVALARATPRRLRRARRYLRIARILARHGLAAYVFTRQRPDLAGSDGRRRLARSLAAALDDAGVTFVKLGQILATRADLLPVEFTEELGRLQTAASPVPWESVRAVLTAELGRPPEEVFAEIAAEPLAAASIAQVHTATTADGLPVVVKVQRPGIEQVVDGDLDILLRLCRRLQTRTRWGRSLGVSALAEGFAQALREELDFRIEARNIAAVAAGSAVREDPAVRVPVVGAGAVTRRVLVMQRLVGVPVDAAPEGVDRPALARTLLEFLLHQVLVDGVFHADPHPGNLLLLDPDPDPDADGPRVGLLDLGSVGRIDAVLRAGLARLLVAVDRADPVAAVAALTAVADVPEGLDERALQRDTGRFLARNLGPGTSLSAALVGELFALLGRHRIGAPPELAAVLRAIGTLEGTLTRLDPTFDVVAGARAFAARQVGAELAPAALRRTLNDELLSLLPLVRGLPQRVDRMVATLEEGRLTVRLAGPPGLTGGAGLNALLSTAIAATTGLMAALLLVAGGGPRISEAMSLHQLFGYLLLVVSTILGLRVLGLVYRRRPGIGP
ncbi:ABC1 kinase family protein [Pseudonocardia lacus]|uniref:ABC1 kinase family protein n=1 Tax=Pseudonocardia lacus TaxID=2835865 RepID=UPI0027E31223|nr:AarF/UbiB family protein [Pseudonocardia lacus]